MARRSDHTREELHDIILEAATGIVANEGLRALSARRIATEIGYSPGSIYNLFTNLDDLIVHLNARTMDRLVASLETVRLTADPIVDVEAIVTRFLEFESENPNLWAAIVQHVGAEGFSQPDWYVAKVDAAMSLAARAIAPDATVLPPATAQLAVRALWASLHGITSLARAGKLRATETMTADAMAHHLTETYLRGLVGQRPRDQS